MNTIFTEDCKKTLGRMIENSFDCCVTSPPYFGLRDYDHEDQIGLEETPEQYVENLVEVFSLVRDKMVDTGTLWLNLGDSYATGGRGYGSKKYQSKNTYNKNMGWRSAPEGLKHKDIIGIPWMVAFALRASGWYLRQDIIWAKPNPMPESVTDRCTKSHEYIFLLTKSPKYFYDSKAIRTPIKDTTAARMAQQIKNQKGSERAYGKTNGTMKAVIGPGKTVRPGVDSRGGNQGSETGIKAHIDEDATANKKSVWTVATRPYKEAHFATFPEALIEPCILAGCPEGGTVYDPFGGAGTTAKVALRAGRKFILSEINPEYVKIANKRLAPLLSQYKLF